MKPTLISSKASNWVDRGEPALPTLARVLAYFFNRQIDDHRRWLEEHANTVLGMVASDATEVHIAGYLRSVATGLADPALEAKPARGAAISLWHIAKAALVRDSAERVLQSDLVVNVPANEPLSSWLAKRLLTPDELERMARED
jgi:hypothetical protein